MAAADAACDVDGDRGPHVLLVMVARFVVMMVTMIVRMVTVVMTLRMPMMTFVPQPRPADDKPEEGDTHHPQKPSC